MDSSPLVTEQLDAGAALAQEFSKYQPLDVVFWLKEGDPGNWYLYLCSDGIDDSNFDLAYGEVLRLVKPLSNLWLDPFQVKVINSQKSPAKNVLAMANRFPAKLMTRIRGQMIDGVYIDEAVVYPPSFQVKVAS